MSEHALECAWTYWYESRTFPAAADHNVETEDDPVLAQMKKDSAKAYEQSLIKLGSFTSLEGFYAYYSWLQRPSTLQKLSSYHVFRNDTPPTWENYPDGGHWLVTMKKANSAEDKQRLDRLWEQLLFALIGEEFEDPDVVGVVVQLRGKEDVLSVWLAAKAPKFRVGEKLKQILHLGPSTIIEYKNNKSSLKDNSGLRNAQAYYVAGEDEKEKKQSQGRGKGR
eukprot:TRINITY_DN69030_c0_g1_i1.p1 TRINITY_DN69030_c0_g1~~TRINITY_DN69030_c0_g1_i1.p1  ORF type:complete len:232 (+),score=47.14 TRINITY_DN69030_c0_g1_i1:29-697(+)